MPCILETLHWQHLKQNYWEIRNINKWFAEIDAKRCYFPKGLMSELARVSCVRVSTRYWKTVNNCNRLDSSMGRSSLLVTVVLWFGWWCCVQIVETRAISRGHQAASSERWFLSIMERILITGTCIPTTPKKFTHRRIVYKHAESIQTVLNHV